MPDTLGFTLNYGEFREDQLFRVHRDDILRFSPGASVLGRKISLFTNYPATPKDTFERGSYHKLQFFSGNGKPLKDATVIEVNDLDIYAEVIAQRAGSFRFYFTCDGKTEHGAVYVQVEPKIYVGPAKARKQVPLDSIRCQTVLAKCLGPITTWEAKLRVAKEAGYNMIHFTPIQELGGSRSCYSLAEQLKVSRI